MLVQPVNNSQNNRSTNFCALYTNIPKIERKVGEKWANGINESLPRLCELAKDVDIFISPWKDDPEIDKHGLDIQVYEKCPDFIKNPIKILKFIWNARYDVVHLKNREIREDENIADKIVQYVTDSKKFLQERI